MITNAFFLLVLGVLLGDRYKPTPGRPTTGKEEEVVAFG